MAERKYKSTVGHVVTTEVLECTFPYFHKKDGNGKFSTNLIMTKKQAQELQAQLFEEEDKLLAIHPRVGAKKTLKPMWTKVVAKDEEGNVLTDEDGEKLFRDDVVKLTVRSTRKPSVQLKKGLDTSSVVGSGSKVQCRINLFSFLYDGKEGVAIGLSAVRVHELVTFNADDSANWGDGDDDFEDAEYKDTRKTDEAGHEEDDEHSDNGHEEEADY